MAASSAGADGLEFAARKAQGHELPAAFPRDQNIRSPIAIDISDPAKPHFSGTDGMIRDTRHKRDGVQRQAIAPVDGQYPTDMGGLHQSHFKGSRPREIAHANRIEPTVALANRFGR